MRQTSERPILFSGPMVRAILDGWKTATRRVVKREWQGLPLDNPDYRRDALAKCPYGQPGERLWVRETWAVHSWRDHMPAREGRKFNEDGGHCLWYAADNATVGGCDDSQRGRWRPSIHMPRWASRISLEIANVRVERVQDISGPDCIAEGVTDLEGDTFEPDTPLTPHGVACVRAGYQVLWDTINASRGYGWDVNPFVWVIEFARVPEKNGGETP